MRQMILTLGVIGFIVFATAAGFLHGMFMQDVCTGTSSVPYHFAVVCSDGFLAYVCVFTAVSFLLMAGLIVLTARWNARPLRRMLVLGLFIGYGIWLMVFSTGFWELPVFMQPHFTPGVNPHCLDCPPATARPVEAVGG